MAAFSNIVIDDGESTPVSHTFEPVFRDGNYFRYEDKAGGVAVGNPRIKAWFTPPKALPNGQVSKYTKARVTLELPILRAISGSTAQGYTPVQDVSHRLVADCHFQLPQVSSTQERDNLIVLLKNLMAHAAMTSMIEDLDPPVGSS